MIASTPVAWSDSFRRPGTPLPFPPTLGIQARMIPSTLILLDKMDGLY
jgi:hypothetical protein